MATPDQPMRPRNGSVPNPDPTERSLDQIERMAVQFQREIMTSREIVESKADGTRQVFETRFSGMDTAIQLLQRTSDKIPQFIKDEVFQLQALHDERIIGVTASLTEKIKSLSDVTTQMFKNIDDRFAEKDKAVSVGLQAQKESAAAQQSSNMEATVKMESNFTKLLDQGRELLTEVRRNTELQINDIKSRLDKGEGRTSVSDPAIMVAIDKVTSSLAGLTTSRDANVGRGVGRGEVFGAIAASVLITGTLVGILVKVLEIGS